MDGYTMCKEVTCMTIRAKGGRGNEAIQEKIFYTIEIRLTLLQTRLL